MYNKNLGLYLIAACNNVVLSTLVKVSIITPSAYLFRPKNLYDLLGTKANLLLRLLS